MLKDVEDWIVRILQEKIVEVPRDNIGVNIKRGKLPAINLSALTLKFTTQVYLRTSSEARWG